MLLPPHLFDMTEYEEKTMNETPPPLHPPPTLRPCGHLTKRKLPQLRLRLSLRRRPPTSRWTSAT